MSDVAIDGLIESGKALIAALDGNDIDAIEGAIPLFGESVRQLKSSGGWQQSPELSARLAEALEIADAARTRACILSDRTQQRIDLLASAAGWFDCTPATYGRPR